VAICLSLAASTNRTCRLAKATPARLRELIDANLHDLERVLAFNVQAGVRMYRISSKLIPFASHPVNTVPWWDEYGDTLARIGAFARRHDIRVSMHPGQYTVLSTPDTKTLDASLREVEWHMRLLDSLGVDGASKVVLHLGGTYDDKEAALGRFIKVVERMPDGWRRRLVVENDERSYTVTDALAVSRRTGLPVVFDYLHHRINPGDLDWREAMAQALATWRQESDGVPKAHFSSQQLGGRPGAHDDWVHADEFARFLAGAPEVEFDCMLEAKQKDMALFRLREELAARGLPSERVA
jgi:UV DNA damage endonuclease